MQPSSHQPGQEYSRSAASRAEASRVRTPPIRPEKYVVPPVPRRVVHAAAPESGEEAVERRIKAKRRLRWKRRLTPWEWAGFAASCIACAFLLRGIVVAEGNFRHLRGQVSEKRVQLAALERQKSEEKNRLAHLQSEEGRDQLLAERGYLKPGTRILLFPNKLQR